jgi:capsular exopolysaccharide synthesis family protein
VLVATAATYVAARAAHKVFASSSTIFVGDRKATLDNFQAVQSAQSLTKTYAELIQSPNVANRVASALGDGRSGADLLNSVTFQPVSDTQLIVISAEAGSARGAAELANRYASTFIDYARTNLTDQTKSDISLVDPAQPASSPIRPRPLLYAAIMFVVSAFLGVGLALLREQFDRKLGDDEELGRALEAPVLARIPRVSARKLAPEKEEQFLEAFRVLRVNLSFVSPTRPVRAVLVTSAEPGEGKTTVSVALARVLAEQGGRVVIIEGDLRRPALAEALESGEGEHEGLAHYLARGGQLMDVLHQTRIDNVWLIPAGVVAPAPSALLQAERLHNLVDAAMEWAEFVIIDSPPLSAGADSSILAHAAGDVLFVINAQRTRRTRAMAAIRQLRHAGARITGLVINGVHEGGEGGYYAYADQPKRARNRLAEELATPIER